MMQKYKNLDLFSTMNQLVSKQKVEHFVNLYFTFMADFCLGIFHSNRHFKKGRPKMYTVCPFPNGTPSQKRLLSL
jgi:hypothetical protein